MGKGEITKNNLLKKAAELVEEKGFHMTTTKEIAIATGVSEATLFKYFHSKDNLLKEIILEIIRPLKEETLSNLIPKILDNNDMDALDKLRVLYRNRRAFLDKHEIVIRILLQELAINDLVRQLFTEDILKMIMETIRQIMMEGVESGLIIDIDLDILVKGFVNQLMIPYLTKSFYLVQDQKDYMKSDAILFDIYMTGITN